MTKSDLAEDLHRRLVGRTLDNDELKEIVLTETPEFRFSDALALLKRQDRAKESRPGGQTSYSFIAEVPKLF